MRRQRPRLAVGLLVLRQALRELPRRLDPQEPAGALHLARRIGDAALELKYEDLVAGKQLQQAADLLEIEAPPGRVADLWQQDAAAALLGLALEAGDRRA